MSQERINITTARPLFSLKLDRWWEQVRHRLYAYRPRFRDWHFWMIQGLVVSIATAHSIVEHPGLLHDLGVPYFIPTTLFLIPVVYAALTFGFAGAVATALWATLLSIHNWILFHEGADLFGCMFQIVVVNAAAFLVGRQADRQKNAWQRAEATASALRASRMKYRSLFESSPIAVLVLGLNGVILEANPAASILFERDKAVLEGMPIADLLGTAGEQKLLSSSWDGRWQVDPLVLELRDGRKLYLEPTLTEVNDGQGNLVNQVLLRDATEEHGRQAGLKAYTAYVIRAQEEERQRIARELHDETIQSLVLLCRRLDSMPGSGESLPSGLSNRLREARETAEQVVRELRDFTKALRPPILDDLGIVASVHRLLTDFEERSRVKSQFKVVGENRRLSPDTELGIFRITQEALRNTERHAEATRVVVTITFTQNEARLDVVDNGVGFSKVSVSSDFTTSGQLGLISMQERAELLGGRLKIQSSPGKGTRVTVSIPVAADISAVSNLTTT